MHKPLKAHCKDEEILALYLKTSKRHGFIAVEGSLWKSREGEKKRNFRNSNVAAQPLLLLVSLTTQLPVVVERPCRRNESYTKGPAV